MKITTYGMLVIFLTYSTFAFSDDDQNAYEKTVAPDQTSLWQKITPDKSIKIISDNGQQRTIHPSCSGGPTPNGTLDSSDYSFFYKQGKEDKLVFFFEGGGACWDNATCNSSISPQGTYLSTLVQTQPEALNGIFDSANNSNPLKDYSFVYLPYCTGDIHIGSNDATYYNAFGLPNSEGVVEPSITVHHRGFDNFLAARDWTRKNIRTRSIEKLVIAGNSAGAYGAAFASSYLSQDFRRADISLMIDAGNGIIIEDFKNNAVRVGGTWGVQQNIPEWTSGIKEAFNNTSYDLPYEFSIAFFSAIAGNNPGIKVGQYSNNWDAVQVLFLNVMNTQAAGGSPEQWLNLGPDVFGEWITNMSIATLGIANMPNYRFYLAPGCDHTILRSQRLYDTTSSEVDLVDWVNALVSSDKEHQQFLNVSCTTADCLPPTPTTLEEILALQAKVGSCINSAIGG